jgi:hypothetical protein
MAKRREFLKKGKHAQLTNPVLTAPTMGWATKILVV